MPNTTLTNPSKNPRGDWSHQLRGGKRSGRIMIMFQNIGGRIMIMFQNIGGMGNASDQPSQHKLDTLKNTMIN